MGLKCSTSAATPCAPAGRSARARVAIVTTAGLRSDGVATWSAGQGFVVLDGAERNLTLAHTSPNFDRTGLADRPQRGVPRGPLD